MKQIRTIEVDGALLNVIIEGQEEAQPVLLWHGAACTLKMWDHVISQLDQHFQFVRFDIRGVGASVASGIGTIQYTFYQYARDAIGILDSLGIDQCHIWSMAWGSRAALAFCSLYPERVKSAALFDASIGPADVEAQKLGHKQALQRQREAGVTPYERPEGWNLHQNEATMRQAMTAATSFDLRAATEQLRMPVLVATGDCDPNLTSSRDIAATIKDARLETMKNVGHGSVLQRPDLAARLFNDFQNSLVRARGLG